MHSIGKSIHLSVNPAFKELVDRPQPSLYLAKAIKVALREPSRSPTRVARAGGGPDAAKVNELRTARGTVKVSLVDPGNENDPGARSYRMQDGKCYVRRADWPALKLALTRRILKLAKVSVNTAKTTTDRSSPTP